NALQYFPFPSEEPPYLPSWASDWSNRHESHHHFALSETFPSGGFSHFSDDFETLVLRGRILDSVNFVSNIKDFTHEPGGLFYDDSGKVADAVAEIILSFRLHCSSLASSPYGNRADQLLAFYRTVTGNGKITGRFLVNKNLGSDTAARLERHSGGPDMDSNHEEL